MLSKRKGGLTSNQLSEWEAYDRLDPIGTWRDDFRIAHLESLIVNIVGKLYGEKGSESKVSTALDFMPDWSGERVEKEQVQQSMEDMKKTMLDIANIQNKKVKKESEQLTRKPKRRQLL